MTSQMRGKGRERHRKVLAKLLDLLSIFFCLGIMSMPSFRFLPHRFAVFRFHCIIMTLNEATVKSNHWRWPLLNFRKVSGFAILVTRAPTGGSCANWRDAGSRRHRRQNPGPVRLRISGKFANQHDGIFIPYRLTQKTKKIAPSPLKFPKDFTFCGTWHD